MSWEIIEELAATSELTTIEDVQQFGWGVVNRLAGGQLDPEVMNDRYRMYRAVKIPETYHPKLTPNNIVSCFQGKYTRTHEEWLSLMDLDDIPGTHFSWDATFTPATDTRELFFYPSEDGKIEMQFVTEWSDVTDNNEYTFYTTFPDGNTLKLFFELLGLNTQLNSTITTALSEILHVPVMKGV